jgi:putative nucleotidyltransferase with HDIG domain
MRMEDLAETIAVDTGLTTRTLRMANSAFSRPASPVTSVLDAIVHIGLVSTVHIITATEVAAIFFSVPGRYGDMMRHWNHHIRVASLAQAYAHQLGLADPGRWFVGGLLHDIGRLIMLKSDPVKYARVLELTDREQVDLREAERVYFGLAHDVAGGMLLDFWHFPKDLSGAAYDHHQDFFSPEDFCTGIGVADLIAHGIDDEHAIPEFTGVPVADIIQSLSKRYEMIKKVSGF